MSEISCRGVVSLADSEPLTHSFYDAKEGKVKGINGSGRSPKALTLAKAREMGIEGYTIKNSNVNSATVAGSAAAWVDIHETWGSGKLTMQQLLQVSLVPS